MDVGDTYMYMYLYTIWYTMSCSIMQACGMVVCVHGILLAREGAVLYMYIIKCVDILFK